MLDIISHLLVVSLVHMPHIVIELLNILPLQVCVTFFLIILYNFYKGKPGKREINPVFKNLDYILHLKYEEQPLTGDNEIIEILH